jgi:hypothetical protein
VSPVYRAAKRTQATILTEVLSKVLSYNVSYIDYVYSSTITFEDRILSYFRTTL